MVHTYTPTHISLQDSIASICKTILPFPFKKRQRLPAIAAAEQRLLKQQSNNLKWQQDSFHQILNLIGLAKEGIVSENEVSTFRTHLLEILITSPIDHEPPLVLRDKLIFLQELLYAKCISEEEYHASKRPLLQRLAVQGAEIDARDVIVGARNETSNEEWSVIDLKDDKCSANQHISTSKKNIKENSSIKQKMKGATSIFGLVSPDKNRKSKENKLVKEVDCRTENPFWNGQLDEKESEPKTILMVESLPSERVVAEKHSHSAKSKKKQSTTVYDGGQNLEKEKAIKLTKKAWGFDGFKKWMKNDSEDERAPLTVADKASSYGGQIVANPVTEGPDTKQIKRKLHPNGDFFVDKVLGEKIKELCRYPDVHLSSWCDQYGDIVKEHVREMGNSGSKADDKQDDAFDDENSHPNHHCVKQQSCSSSDNIRGSVINSSIDKGFKYNPFFDM